MWFLSLFLEYCTMEENSNLCISGENSAHSPAPQLTQEYWGFLWETAFGAPELAVICKRPTRLEAKLKEGAAEASRLTNLWPRGGRRSLHPAAGASPQPSPQPSRRRPRPLGPHLSHLPGLGRTKWDSWSQYSSSVWRLPKWKTNKQIWWVSCFF